MAEQKQSLYLRVQEKLSNVSTVNSYKELCKLLDEPNYSSPSQKKFQKKQLENWKKCFTWRKNKDKFTCIKIISPDEYYHAVAKELYQNTAIWIFCAFLNVYGQYTKGESLCMSKGDLAIAIGLQNENYKQFHFSPYSYGRRLEEYTLNLRDSKYPFVTQPKKEIRELRNNKETAHNITKRTQNLLDDYDSHTSKQNFYQIETIIDKLAKEGVIFSQDIFIGGFIEKDKLPFNADYSTIYEEDGNFYLPLKDKPSLLVTYKERPLKPNELNIFVNIRGKIFAKYNCKGYSDILEKGLLKEFQKELTHSLIINLGALFAYPSYLIRYSTEHIAVCASLYKQTSDIDDVLLKKNLTTNNKETQKKISKLKKSRQAKETPNSRNVINQSDGTVYFIDKKEEEAFQLSQYYETFLYEKLNKDLIQLNLDKLIPQNFNSLPSNSTEKSSIWEDLFNKSWTKIKNYQDKN